ncbi:hypothetical protein NQ314_017600 [Rhamnusium bicolor]|uniref:MADF domain-containing protein n=1 Tax=Rhamnusium bicolor TaxID=1586634 RepID=A0AAV8WTE0_9CUCU|nr:hypothetical protein NQ314_017600 [Rhamnusium bicolor]
MSEIDDKEQVMKGFIETFETMPVLWESRNVSYKNKKRRGEALETLLAIYRRESEDSQASGVITPSSPPTRSGPNPNSSAAIESPTPVEATPIAGSSVTSLKSPAAPTARKRPKGPIAKQNELLALVCNYLKSPDKEDTNDEFENIAKVWAHKLRNLEPGQRMFAEMEINDILFEAGLNALHRNSVKVNEASTSSEVYTGNQPGYACTYESGSSNSQFSGPHLHNIMYRICKLNLLV